MRKIQKDKPPWLLVAEKELGVKEHSPGENQRIITYHSFTTLMATKDEVPWCSSFVSFCLESCGIESTKSAWARSYESWGKKLKKPKKGCIAVFRRGPLSSGKGHVCFYISNNTKDSIRCLGGNSANQVRYETRKKSDLICYRWPNA